MGSEETRRGKSSDREMSSRNVLLVVLEPFPDEKIRAAVQSRAELGDATVHVVAPAVSSGMLRWLTGDDHEARAEAEELASRTADALEAEVETEVGDRDPVLAVEDALSTFQADEIVLAGEASADIEEALRDLGLPISHLNGGSAGAREERGGEAVAHQLARGYRTETPFVLLAIVGAVTISAIALISLISLLVFWLA
jgi:hypothetical protein